MSLLYGVLDHLGGVHAIQLAMGLLTGLLGWLIWSLTKPARSLVVRVCIAALVMAIGSAMWAPRPLLIGLVLLALTVLAAEGRIAPWILLPAMWVWVNSHGSFPMGLVLLVTLAFGTKLDGGQPTCEIRCLKWAGAGVLLGIVNPLGPVLVLFPVKLLSRQSVLSHIVEWQSPSFSEMSARIFLIQVVVAVVALTRRPSYRVAIPLVVFVAAALLGLRNIAVASIVITPGIAKGFADLGRLDGRERGRGVWAGVAVILVLSLVVGSVVVKKPGYDLSSYPLEALEYVERSGWKSSEVTLLTQESVGNYLELAHGVDARVFMDDRVDMYPKEVVEQYMTLLRGRPGWDDVLETRGVDVVLWETREPLVQLLASDPSWRVAYTGGRWTVACRRTSAVLDNC